MPISRLGPIYDPLRNRGVPLLPYIYVGFVKRNDDAQRMGRLSIWIPDIGGAADDPASWIIASYASPFAGATDITAIPHYTTDPTVAQQSYGFWAVPPDLNCEVVVFFAGGDQSRAFWFGCVWQQNMTHMVPGVAVNVTTEPMPPKHVSPVIEYNKSDSKMNIDSPRRPPFKPLTDGLKKEGLPDDQERGSSSSSARREAPSQVFGMLSPKANQMYIDDNPDNEFIRLRTKSGTQVLVNETSGYVYINSKNGDSWIEISDAGVDIYSKHSVSIRAEEDFNIRADRNINLDAGNQISTRSGHNTTMESGKDFETKVGNNSNTSVAANQSTTVDKQINVKAKDDYTIESTKSMGLKAGSNMRTESTGDTSHKSSGGFYRDGGKGINDNSGTSPGAPKAGAGFWGGSATAGLDPSDPKSYEKFQGKFVGNNQECASLSKAVANLPPTSTWSPGAAVSANNIPPCGTAVATFGASGKYENSYESSHTMISLGPAEGGGMKVLEQWNGQPSKISTYQFGGSGIHNAGNYRVVNT